MHLTSDLPNLRVLVYRDNRPSPETQSKRSSTIARHQLQRHQDLLEQFVTMAGNNRVSAEIMKAVKDGLNYLKFESADAQLKYRFKEKQHSDESEIRPVLNVFSDSNNDLYNISILQGREKEPSDDQHKSQFDDAGMRFVLKPISSNKESTSSKEKLPDLNERGLYKRSILGSMKRRMAEPEWLMRRIKFPEIAYKYLKRIQRLEDLAAENGQFHCSLKKKETLPLQILTLVSVELRRVSEIILNPAQKVTKCRFLHFSQWWICEGWVEETKMCLAPYSFVTSVQCSSSQPFGFMSNSQKQEAESAEHVLLDR